MVDFAGDSFSQSGSSQGYTTSSDASTPVPPTVQTTPTATIWIRTSGYFRLNAPILGAAATTSWIEGLKVPAGTFGAFGVLATVAPIDTLAADGGVRGVSVENRGAAIVSGVPTTKYAVTLPACHLKGSTGLDNASESQVVIWVDDQGRLIQARGRSSYSDPGSSSPSRSNELTSAKTVRLYDFGAPTRIDPPAASRQARTWSPGASRDRDGAGAV